MGRNYRGRAGGRAGRSRSGGGIRRGLRSAGRALQRANTPRNRRGIALGALALATAAAAANRNRNR